MRCVALLRAVNVGGAALAMGPLREACGELGWRGVTTYIQSGNILFDADEPPAALEEALERLLKERFGLERPVLVRSAEKWRGYASGSPFREVQEAEPNRLLLALSKLPPNPSAAELLRAKAAAGERIVQEGEALWVHYPAGAGTSKLSPAGFDKAAGSPVTARNWRTVTKINEMLGTGRD